MTVYENTLYTPDGKEALFVHQINSDGADVNDLPVFSNPTNSNTVSVATTSTELVPAAAVGIKARQIIICIKGTRTVYIKEGDEADTTHFDCLVNDILRLDTLLAVNGIVASGAAGVVSVFVEARS